MMVLTKTFANFRVKIVINIHESNLIHFIDKMGHLFFLKIEAIRSESVKQFLIYTLYSIKKFSCVT